jgi:hypothetical protein
MYISFNLDDTFYSGTATLREDQPQIQYVIDLNDSNPEPIQFVLRLMDHNKEWSCDDEIDPQIVSAAASEIEKEQHRQTEEPMIPSNYRSDANNPVDPQLVASEAKQ